MKQKLTCSFVIPNTTEGHEFVALLRKYRNPEMKVKINLCGRGPRPKEPNRSRSRYQTYLPIPMAKKICVYTSIDRTADNLQYKVKSLEADLAARPLLREPMDAVAILRKIEAMVANLSAEKTVLQNENRRMKDNVAKTLQALQGIAS